ncbi:hypothetical protein IPV08_05385 [Methylobacterium sp. SD274]|uniref:hypothetical protein n=1 Tax=unclassified Methylobacterium TaxID=2615210 RepID=UPI0006FF6F3F|nr:MULTISPECIES: hypothetical protein [unclassified Methylobacterium]KQO49506.1 hypothetical protein ASF24_08270 [Methylobacterium sp. Leaf86]KQP00826.1 hypothetical protein ASF32_01685 [Methylobacterium sp. Leaf91]MBO1019396.1 hypothetical protein [Methylobacterium sp. SD274]
MPRRVAELRGDPAFGQAVHAVRGAASVLSGRAVTQEEAELLVSFALAAYANAGGLTEPSLSRLSQFSNTLPPEEKFETLLKH